MFRRAPRQFPTVFVTECTRNQGAARPGRAANDGHPTAPEGLTHRRGCRSVRASGPNCGWTWVELVGRGQLRLLPASPESGRRHPSRSLPSGPVPGVPRFQGALAPRQGAERWAGPVVRPGLDPNVNLGHLALRPDPWPWVSGLSQDLTFNSDQVGPIAACPPDEAPSPWLPSRDAAPRLGCCSR